MAVYQHILSIHPINVTCQHIVSPQPIPLSPLHPQFHVVPIIIKMRKELKAERLTVGHLAAVGITKFTPSQFEYIAENFRLATFFIEQPYVLIPYTSSCISIVMTVSQVTAFPRTMVLGQVTFLCVFVLQGYYIPSYCTVYPLVTAFPRTMVLGQVIPLGLTRILYTPIRSTYSYPSPSFPFSHPPFPPSLLTPPPLLDSAR